jgi:hypothetical protein
MDQETNNADVLHESLPLSGQKNQTRSEANIHSCLTPSMTYRWYRAAPMSHASSCRTKAQNSGYELHPLREYEADASVGARNDPTTARSANPSSCTVQNQGLLSMKPWSG